MARVDFGSHSYWRIQTLWHTFMSLTALAFRDETGTLIPATGGTPIESSHFSTFDASFLFDGVDATFWESSNPYGPWAGYHFASPVKVMQMGVQQAASMGGSQAPPSVWAQYSDDGVVWGDACVFNLQPLVNDVMRWFDFAEVTIPDTARPTCFAQIIG